jgi:hypothetical protein
MAPVALKHFLCAIDSKQYIAMRKALITSLKLMHTEEEWWGPVGHPPNNGHHGEGELCSVHFILFQCIGGRAE